MAALPAPAPLLRRVRTDAAEDPANELRLRSIDALVEAGKRLRDDPDVRARFEARAQDISAFAVRSYGDELTAVITETVERWNGEDAARRIELHVGRDLQFIRINGTVVGGACRSGDRHRRGAPDLTFGPRALRLAGMPDHLMILDQHFRTVDELFRSETLAQLRRCCVIAGGSDRPMDASVVDRLLQRATFHVAARPALTRDQVMRARNLRAVIEVAGAFHGELDYEACFERGIEVLSCSPGFRFSVAEMTVAMILAGARGLVQEHEAFRGGEEHWVADRPETDFTLYANEIGFIGYGQIARETHRLLRPFAPIVRVHDPWVTDLGPDAESCDLPALVERSRVVVVAAAPSPETRGILSAELIERLRPGALVVLISRAYCVDFAALVAAAASGRIRAAIDVFPDEPVPPDDPLRRIPNLILSPHRAAAVPGGRHPIGDMILHDVRAILAGRPERRLKPADPVQVAGLAAAQDEIAS